ncbi:MAG: hypothetical protein RBT62_08110 [Spirochaetia bacterium]|jgi:hypothetical protein|nr:hypothetical protein [Spirochaetia bacterium]
MKKLVLVLSFLVVGMTVFAADINLGDFPVGSWIDANYDAVWEFTSNNIRILGTDGSVIWDFSEKTINDFKVSIKEGAPAISLSCPEAGRSYTFIKPLTNTTLKMEIARPDKDLYTVTMAKK